MSDVITLYKQVKSAVENCKQEKGQGVIEYAVLLAFVVAVAAAVGSSGTLRESISSVFTSISTLF